MEKAKFIFPFVGKHKNDLVGHPRNSITTTTDRCWSTLWSTVVTAWPVTSSFSETWPQNTQQNRATLERGGTAQKKGDGVTHHTRQHYSALELNNKFQFSDIKGALNQTKILPVSLQEIKPQNLFICSFVHNSVTLPLEKQTNILFRNNS